MIIYTVITQNIKYDGSHQNSVDNFRTLEEAKAFVDSCVNSQKTLEGKENFAEFGLSGSMHEYGWLFSGKIVYGIEMQRAKEGNPGDTYTTKRFVIPTLVP